MSVMELRLFHTQRFWTYVKNTYDNLSYRTCFHTQRFIAVDWAQYLSGRH